MTRLSEQLEHDAEIARSRLAGDLDELRHRMTPGQIVDEVADYARETPLAEFLRNLGRDIRDNPLPLLLIGIGVAWCMIASSLRPRLGREYRGPAEPVERQPTSALARDEWEVASLTPAADS